MSRNWTTIVAGVILTGFVGAGGVWAEGSGAEDLFYQGWYAETSEGDLEKAIGFYRKAVEREREEQEVAARAQLQIGACLEKLGRADEAAAAYRTVLDKFGGQRETAEKAAGRLREIEKSEAGAAGDKPQAHGGFLADLGSEDPKVFDAAFSLLAALGPDGGAELRRGLDALEAKSRGRAGLALDALADGIVDGPSARMWGRAHTQKVQVNFVDTPLVDIIEYLRELSQLNMVIDGSRVKIDQIEPITLTLRDLALHNVLKLMCAQYSLEVVYGEGVVTLTTPEGAQEMRAAGARRAAERRSAVAHPLEAGSADAQVRTQLESTRISLDFAAAPFSDVVAFLRDFTGVNFVIDIGADPEIAERPVTLRVKDLALDRCLTMLCETNGAKWAVKDGTVWIGGRR